MDFTRAIVRQPGKSIVSGLSGSSLDLPVYEKALEQHRFYVQALQDCGLEVMVLDPLEQYPDSTFVEDVAVLTPECAVITAPGAQSRATEIDAIKTTLENIFPRIESIISPGTLEGGDVMQIGTHYFIGLSGRTNEDGARQLIAILEKYGMTGSTIPVHDFLHLKTGVTWVGNNTLVAESGFVRTAELQKYHIIQVDEDEKGAANCLCLGNNIMMSAGYAKTKQRLSAMGSNIVVVDISEYAKIDGGLTCLSLRF
jgi:dimethylargininase